MYGTFRKLGDFKKIKWWRFPLRYVYLNCSWSVIQADILNVNTVTNLRMLHCEIILVLKLS